MPPVRIFDVEWDARNINHATTDATMQEVTQAIRNARLIYSNPNKHGSANSKLISETDGGRKLVIMGNYDPATGVFRPITSWETK
ncbi:MAG TPA: hypothetical protein VGG83_25660 [Trebonia sp.]|nr:hypothetical protein [Sporichthyaceae bacterium]